MLLRTHQPSTVINSLVKMALLQISLVTVLAGCSPATHRATTAKPAMGAELQRCSALIDSFQFADTKLTAVHEAAANELQVAGSPVGAHCVVTGSMHERISAVDKQRYAIGFELRLPQHWNGRFLFQANGGLAGSVLTATGEIGGGGPLTNALREGFAVISSDMGHSSQQNPLFGLDPQARLDYGYAAVAALTPMAKNLIKTAYGKQPDYSYLAGCSNGGRVAMVAASRYVQLYDGFLAGNPGMHLPKSAVAQMYGAQQYARVATGNDLSTAFTVTERQLVASKILDKCDALDGVNDGMVLNSRTCQQRFDLQRDVPTCSAARDGSCLSNEQKSMLGNIFTGARTSTGQQFYAPFPYDPGMIGTDWANWEFNASTSLDPAAVAFVFTTPPNAASLLPNLRAYTMGFDLDRDTATLSASAMPYDQSALSFMTPPDETYGDLQQAGGKLLVYHGSGDAVFSATDTANWYQSLRTARGEAASEMARFFEVPGMNHCRGGPATDQFDMLSALVKWVELRQAPERIVATARVAGNVGGANAEVPTSWGARTRPLCAYPKTAHYNGSGDLNSADSFSCRE